MTGTFISHRRSDTALAERLAEDLRSLGHEVWFDEWEIDLGDSIVEKMNAGLTTTRALVLCCSASGVEAPWIGREWMSALARQLNGHGIKVLPVLLTGSELPPLLADLRYADLRTNYATGLAELDRALERLAP
ncbi:toll/interleukin-1 receptor domain-containing protein [Solirubrobacter ginsenosidimutans]|uniref:Toll/interleukin-1 receptor domain-containing protein n=1 Tax=Solirubrobacter ginsenosidimutans TaxID=490573 RepID=A0A9X3S4U2_9ACTN|nr:toll/interleukin-1 receptor domain-containing protein [Solirubrobacter ginsenosidimutans]MDA0166214.1 toll/interleukin-1 receptor domain-containing protein [Solirubrobacter ginsenosidimutans]